MYFYRHEVFYDVREEGEKGTECMNFYLLNVKKALADLINSDDWLFSAMAVAQLSKSNE